MPQARPDLSVQDITALLVSLTNLSLSCYPDKLEYVDQILGFAHGKIKEYGDKLRRVITITVLPSAHDMIRSPDVHSPQTTSNLASLLAAPINSYQSVLTLLAIPRYSSLLSQQPYSTRRSLSHAVISSILKNETIIETPEDVNGVLELCHVLIKDQSDSGSFSGTTGQQSGNKDPRRQGPYPDREDIAEEQGWVARMVHLFRANSVDTQFEVIAAPVIHLPF